MCFPCRMKYSCWQSKNIKHNDTSTHEKSIFPLFSDKLQQFAHEGVQVAH